MKILVIGASQGTGARTVEQALERGHHVTAFARSPDKLVLQHPNLTRLRGDFHDRACVEGAVPGHDAVIVTASASSLKTFKENPFYFSSGTQLVVAAMTQHGLRRLVVLSAFGTGDTRRLLPPLVRFLMVDLLLKTAFADHERQETLVRDSGLDWVIARPTRLTNGPARRRYQKTSSLQKVPSAISRADVADFMVEACVGDAWTQRSVQLGG